MDGLKPHLLVFAPCERVIIGAADDNAASLIAILPGFTAAGELPTRSKDDEKFPAFPMTWWIFSLWENDYSGADYRFRCEMTSPNSNRLWEQEGPLGFKPDKRFQRVNIKMAGFPLDGFGDYLIDAYSKIEGGEFQLRGRFPVRMDPKK